MKKMRVILSILAIVFAIGGAIASSSEFADQNPVYDWVGGECREVSLTCGTMGNIACKVNPGDPRVLRSSSDDTIQCGDELVRFSQGN